jgi:Tol biopolymer transport system component
MARNPERNTHLQRSAQAKSTVAAIALATAVLVVLLSAGNAASTPAPTGGQIVFTTALGAGVYAMNADGTNVRQLAPADSSDPALSPDGTRIAFRSTRAGGSGQLYVMNVDGSNVRRLTNDSGDDDYPAWSPDGTKIAYASDRDHPDPGGAYEAEVYVINTDGTGDTRLTFDGGYQPSWAPNGTSLAYAYTNGGLRIVNADGTGEHVVAGSPSGSADDHPAWSPDGTTIAFDRYGLSGLSGLYTLPATGGAAAMQLATTATDAGRPSWSPDGQWLAFDTGDERFSGNYSGEIGVIAADGTGEHVLTTANHPKLPSWSVAYSAPPAPTGAIAFTGSDGIATLDPATGSVILTHQGGEWPAISPDGTKIAFASEISGDRRLYVMNTDGTGVVELTHPIGNAFDQNPTWSADGAKIAFTHRDASFNLSIWVMNADGTNTHALTGGPLDQTPSWAADGRIAFERSTGSNFQLWVMNGDGTGQHQVTLDGDIDLHADWSPDGTQIAFSRGTTLDTLQLWKVDLATGVETRLTNDGATDLFPTWSPDGNWIAYSSNVNVADYWDIFIVSPGGGTPVAVTSGPGLDFEPNWGTAPKVQPAPTVTIDSGPSNISGSSSATLTFHADQTGVTFQCITDGVGGSSAINPCSSPLTLTGLADGFHLLDVMASNGGPFGAVAEWTWYVDTNTASGDLLAGGTLTTEVLGIGPTQASPVEVTLMTPVAGQASISETAPGVPPFGYQFLGQEVDITAPLATAANPLVITFDVDQSILGGATASTLQLFRNGVAIPDCPGSGQASPDPCVRGRVALASGDIELTVNTSHASVWNVGLRKPVPAELADLTAMIRGYGLDQGTTTSLLAKVTGSCGQLGALGNAAQAQRGKKLTRAQADAIVVAAATIRTQLGC